jgi:Zn-dependent protease
MSDPSFALALRDALMYLVALVLSICVHEYGHAWVADKLGDPLPRAQGRVTLNPAAHVDPVGTILFPMLGFFFAHASPGIAARMVGWGKPVQVSLSPRHMTRRMSVRTSHMLIALAGPLMNILFALVLSAIFIGLLRAGADAKAVGQTLLPVIAMNVGLACFNLLPCPPLDGGAVLRGILPRQLDFISDTLEKYGFMIFFLLLMTGALSTIMAPAHQLARWWLQVVTGLALGQ